MIVAVTGANGFIGSHVAAALLQAGHDVRRLDSEHGFRLGAPLSAHGDVLVHCAHDWRRGSDRFNVRASKQLFGEAREQGFKRIVFLSSLASSAGAKSHYGRDKHEIEALLDPQSDAIIRPGLVVGPGGLFASMRRSIAATAVAPVFAGGKQPVYTIGIGDLTRAIVRIIERRAAGLFVLAHSDPIQMGDFLRAIAKSERKSLLLVPLPYRATLFAVSLAEKLRIPVPISAESVRGLRNLRIESIPSYPDLGLRLQTLSELLEQGTTA